jgi:arylsulfatase A-like enzyme
MSSSDINFGGVIGRTLSDSVPEWTDPPAPSEGSPNIVFILLDDTGFAHFGCYGSNIDTPNFDRLANGGIRYSNFHTTALCSPTRACLLTGRNHHSVGMRGLSNWNTGFPNCRGRITSSAATIAEILRTTGYSAFATGKWHLTPMDETSVAGPFDNWPLQRGFDRYYGFLQGETHQFYPELFCDNHPVDPPQKPDEGYHLTEDIVDMSIRFVGDQKSAVPEKPFFLYMCFGATHAPHHAPKEYIDKYKGRFDRGWDTIREEYFQRQKASGLVPENTDLAPPNEGVRPWDDLNDDEKRLFIRYQEAFAGMLDHTDHHVGRFIDFLDGIGELDNTLIFLLADNGASMEGGPIGVMDTMKGFNLIPEDFEDSLTRIDEIGGPRSENNYPMGWAQAGNTPLKRYKRFTHGGGVRDPLIIHWPKGIKEQDGIRRQFHHVIDIVPTVLDVLGIDAPEVYHDIPQKPIEGMSMKYTFESEHAAEPSHKHIQYFEMAGNRGIYYDGWKAVAYHEPDTDFEEDKWELYNLEEDFSECHNLAQSHPEKLKAMIERWWTEAGKYDVLPLDDRLTQLFTTARRQHTPSARRRYIYYPPVSHMTTETSPVIGNRSWNLMVDVDRPDDKTEGVLIARGTNVSGLSFYIKNNRLIFDYNLFSTHYRAISEVGLPVGRSTLGVRFERIDQEGRATVLINGEDSGTVSFPRVLRIISAAGMDIGRDALSPVTDDYDGEFAFTGKIIKVVFDVPRRIPKESEQEYREAESQTEMGRQ